MARPIPSAWPLLWRDAPEWPAWSDRPKQRRRHRVHPSVIAYISTYLLSSFFWGALGQIVKTCAGPVLREVRRPSIHLRIRSASRSALVQFPTSDGHPEVSWPSPASSRRIQAGCPPKKAIAASKKKNDRLDARKIADLVWCNLLPACYVAPAEIRELRRMLRYRNLVVGQATRMKNKVSGLLMEVGAEYNKQQLHGKQYFTELLDSLEEVPESVKDLLRLSRGAMEMFETTQQRLLARLERDSRLAQRVILLNSIRSVGPVTALTWILEVGDPRRFSSVAQAVSYCGLTSALDSSADKQKRGPISKQRNAHLQTVVIEAAKLGPRWNPQLAALHARESERGNCNRATLAVARKLVAYLLAVDKSGQPFQPRTPCDRIAGWYETASGFAGDVRGRTGCRLPTQVRADYSGLGPLLVGRQAGAADQIRRHGRSPDHEHEQPDGAGEGRKKD